MSKILVFISILVLSSCANVNNYSDKEFGDISNYQNKVKNFIVRTAKDPKSIKIISMSKPKKTFIQNMNPSALWNPFFPVYGICVSYIGANSYGANLDTTENFYIKDGHVLYNMTTLDKYEPCLMK